MIRNLVRRVILWAAPKLGLPSPESYAQVGLSEGAVEVPPETFEAFGHELNRLNR